MLVYHAFSDVNHGVFRAFVLQKYVFGESIELDYWRILDFLYVFPHKAKSIRVPQSMVSEKRKLGALYNKYNDVPFPREFLARFSAIHTSITAILSSKGVVSEDELQRGRLQWQATDSPDGLLELVEARAKAEATVIDFLRNLRHLVPATGPDGIKARSGWLEHRYDA